MDTAIDVAMRPAEHKLDPAAKAWPGDRQGFTLLSHADTAENWAQHQKQWVKHETTFTAPADMVGARGRSRSVSLAADSVQVAKARLEPVEG